MDGTVVLEKHLGQAGAGYDFVCYATANALSLIATWAGPTADENDRPKISLTLERETADKFVVHAKDALGLPIPKLEVEPDSDPDRTTPLEIRTKDSGVIKITPEEGRAKFTLLLRKLNTDGSRPANFKLPMDAQTLKRLIVMAETFAGSRQ